MAPPLPLVVRIVPAFASVPLAERVTPVPPWMPPEALFATLTAVPVTVVPAISTPELLAVPVAVNASAPLALSAPALSSDARVSAMPLPVSTELAAVVKLTAVPPMVTDLPAAAPAWMNAPPALVTASAEPVPVIARLPCASRLPSFISVAPPIRSARSACETICPPAWLSSVPALTVPLPLALAR